MSLNVALITVITLLICLQVSTQLKFHAVQFLEFGNELNMAGTMALSQSLVVSNPTRWPAVWFYVNADF